MRSQLNRSEHWRNASQACACARRISAISETKRENAHHELEIVWIGRKRREGCSWRSASKRAVWIAVEIWAMTLLVSPAQLFVPWSSGGWTLTTTRRVMIYGTLGNVTGCVATRAVRQATAWNDRQQNASRDQLARHCISKRTKHRIELVTFFPPGLPARIPITRNRFVAAWVTPERTAIRSFHSFRPYFSWMLKSTHPLRWSRKVPTCTTSDGVPT